MSFLDVFLFTFVSHLLLLLDEPRQLVHFQKCGWLWIPSGCRGALAISRVKKDGSHFILVERIKGEYTQMAHGRGPQARYWNYGGDSYQSSHANGG
jgi:hypothetical protein